MANRIGTIMSFIKTTGKFKYWDGFGKEISKEDFEKKISGQLERRNDGENG